MDSTEHARTTLLPKRTLREFFIGAVLIVVSVTLSVFILEFVLRLTPLVRLLPNPGIPRYYYQADREIGYDIAPNFPTTTSTFRAEGLTDTSHDIWSNELGCYDIPYHGEQPYVLLLGDSFTWGYAPFDDIWGTVVEKNIGTRILKCGVAGFGTQQELVKAERLLKKLPSPSLLLLAYNANDAADDANMPNRFVYNGMLIPNLMAMDVGERLLNREEFSFSYRGIPLGRIFIPPLHYYLVYFLYYLDIAISVLEEPCERVILYASVVHEVSTMGVLAKLNSQALPDALRLVCRKRGITLDILATATLQDEFLWQFQRRVFIVKRAMFGLLMRALNAGIRAFVGKKKIRILASELWKNIESLIHELPECELVLLDRAESAAVGLRGIIRSRMQFIHSTDFVTGAMRRIAHNSSAAFLERWEKEKMKHKTLQQTSFRGYALLPILEEVMQNILLSSEKVARDIEGAWTMMEMLRPDIVLVRASTSGQTHFAVLCEVARLVGIPSLEIQHGMLSVAPESETKNRAAEYIAEYGPLDRRLWNEYGNAPRSELIDVGSPRFDAYIAEKQTREKKPGVCEILYIAPEVSVAGYSDSYDVCAYVKNIASAARGIPHAQVTIKLRASHAHEAFYREALRRAFGDAPYTIAIFESLVDLLPAADVVVSSYSTALLEALLSGRPVIFDASLPIYASVAHFDLKPHRDAGALVVVETGPELTAALARLVKNPKERNELSARARKFMRENYLFHDGKSSERLAAAIRRLC